MIKTARTMILIMLALAIVSGPAVAQQTFTGAGAASGTGGEQTFTLGGYTFSLNSINQVDATRLQEMGVQTVSVPAGTTVYVTSTGQMSAITGDEPTNMIVFGPGGFVGAQAWMGGTMPTYTFTGNAGQYNVITLQSGGTRDMVLVSFD